MYACGSERERNNMHLAVPHFVTLQLQTYLDFIGILFDRAKENNAYL